jgi:[protein-PII] uridylyltransferase
MNVTELYASVPNRRDIIDRRVIADALHEAAAGVTDVAAKRTMLQEAMKSALDAGRTELKNRLHGGAKGPLICRAHSFLIDQIVRIAFDFITSQLYRLNNATESERLSLLAVGGYGRAELALQSDIDILFLTPYKQTAWGEQVIETMLYLLWDLRLKVGHASRSMTEMIAMAKEDLSVRTALLEARYLWGDVDLFEMARTSFRKHVVAGTQAQFVQEKLAERDARHKKMGDSRYVVEPNLKEGKGGLRDLHTLYWIGKYLHSVDDTVELIERGLFSAEEHAVFRKAEEFLLTVRCHLHDITNRPEERLTFDVQRELASRLGYKDRPGASGVERFMKHYFLTAKQVGNLTRVFLAHLQEQTRKKPLFRLPSAINKRLRHMDGFIIDGGRINIEDVRFFKQAPIRLIKLFHLADLHGLEPHPNAMRQANIDATQIGAELRSDAEANALFLDILCSPRDPETILRWMNESGVFGRFVPDFGRVIAQMQFDMYHHYTVDEHSIRAIGLLAKIEKGALKQDHPIGTALMQKIVSRRVLYVAVLLHDIAKGRNGDHSVLGAEVAHKLCPRLGMSAAETDMVAWLVRQHLMMSDTAFKRDLSDFKTIMDFAEKVQSPERLKLLLLLTTVDIRAVGPGIWNDWKGQLLRALYEATEEVLLAGHKESGRAQRIATKQADLAAKLQWPGKIFSHHAKRFYDSYWIAESLDILELNAKLVRTTDDKKASHAIACIGHYSATTSLVALYAQDHPGLFFRLSGAIALAGATILGAKIHTTRDGMALDNFIVQTPGGEAFDAPDQLARLEIIVADALAGKIKLADRLAAKPLPRTRAEAFASAPAVLMDSKASNRYTVIEINAMDRPGLLYALTTALYAAKVTIHSAHIATFGERAVDVFYVTDLTNDKIVSSSRLKTLEKRLLEAATGVAALAAVAA